jgi:hypothetical protein
MNIVRVFSALLLVGLLSVSPSLAGDKKKDKDKDKLAEWQKEQWEAQQKLQQWKLQQQQQQQPPQQQRRPLPQAAAGAPASSVPVRLAIYNYTAAPVTAWWVSFDGSLQSYGTVEPAQPGDQPSMLETFAGHSWQFKAGRQLVKSFTAGGQPVQQLVLGNAGAIVNQRRERSGVTMPIPEPPDVSTGNGIVVQRRGAVPVDEEAGVVVNTRPIMPPDAGNAGLADTTNREPAVVDFLRVHNAERAAVGAPPLQWSDKLARHAQQWADQITATGNIAHRPNNIYGENLAGQTPPFTPAAAANYWLEEKAQYRRGQANFNEAGHYTQMVWSGTTHVGYGIAHVNGMTVIVANYEPAGNVLGQLPY